MLTGIMETASTAPATRSPIAAASRSCTIAAHKTSVSTVPPISSATNRAPFWPRASLVDRYEASAEFLTVQCADGSLSLCSSRHLHKRESLGPTRISILNYVNLLHLAVRLKRLA